MKSYVKIILFFIFSAYSIVYSKPSDKIKFESGELTELEYNFFTKVDNGETNDLELHYDGFIIASGITDEEEFKFYRQKLNDIRSLAEKELSQYVKEGPYEFGKKLLDWLYSSGILKKYFETSTLFQDLIYKGEYNCLSSSILYSLLYKDFGFNVTGVLTSSHSFCMVYTEDKEIDVETTISKGFNPGQKEIRNTGSSTIVTFVPQGNYRDRNNVDILTLIATLYPNSISLKKIEKDLEKQLVMAKKAYYLSPNTKIYNDNLVNAYNRLALDYLKKNNFKDAYNTLEEAFIFDSNNAMTKNNRVHYYNTIGTSYLKKKDFPNAIEIYKTGISDIGEDSDVLKRNLKVSYYNYAVTEYNQRRYNNAGTISEEALKLFPNDRDFMRLLSSIPK
ncbi:lipopolysaccharide assembly protein LapB [uncultured Brachyspira sp.]|uniref:tetratricopeptide repeat protein n=1 Tax=uncultured Brachyspira sp. TaxID=221953 RepID=UPI0025F93604|nr:tetratricopeptide repeat protein [uncultured Brachyspira sp.]